MKKYFSLVTPILWFFTTGCWIVCLCMDFVYQAFPGWPPILHGLCAATALLSAIITFIQYRNEKKTKKAAVKGV